MTDSTQYRLYRFYHENGQTKDWAIGVHSSGTLRIRYGKTDQTARLSEVPPEKCQGTASEEMIRRINKKIDEGYKEIGLAKINSRGRLEEIQSDKPEVALYWEINKSLDEELLKGFFHDVQQRLEGTPGITLTNPDGKGLVLQSMNHETFTMGLFDEGGIDATLRGGGKVTAKHGPVSVLLLAAFKRIFQDQVVIADHEADVVELRVSKNNPYLETSSFSFDEIRDIGVRLDLCMKPVKVNKEGNTGLWF